MLSSRATRRVARLVTDLGSPNDATAILAEEVLIRYYGVRALEPLLDATEHQNSQVRLRAGWVLGKTRDVRAFDALLALTHDPDGHTRYDAAIALGNLSDVRGIEPLIGLMLTHDPEHCVDSAAAMGLMRLAEFHPTHREKIQDVMEASRFSESSKP